MMTIRLISKVILFLSIPLYVNAQDATADSMRAILALSSPDSSTIDALYALNDHLRHYDFNDSLVEYTQIQVDIAQRIGHQEAVAWGYFDQAGGHWDLGNFNLAIASIEKAITAFRNIEDTTRVFNSVYLKGMILGDTGQFNEALENYYDAIRGFKKLGKGLNHGAVLNSVALIHQWIGEPEEAERSFRESIKILEREKNEARLAISMSNLGHLLAEQGRLQEALDIQHEVLRKFKKLNDEWGIASAKGNIGYALLKLNKPEEALPNLNENVDFQRAKNDPKELASTLMMRAEVYLALNDTGLARADLLEATDLTKTHGIVDYEIQALASLSNLAVKRRDYETAFKTLERSTELKDTLFAKDKIRAISEATFKYESEKKESEIALLSSENERKNIALQNESNIRIALVIGLLFLSLIAALVYSGQRKRIKAQQVLSRKNKEIREAQFQERVTDLELKALRAQMDPHFIFNSMNSINRLILEDRNEEASRSLSRFGKLIRLILDHSEKRHVSLKEELSLLETYIQLESARFKGRMSYIINVQEALDADQVMIPSMILQPFVENAIWHGLMHRTEAGGLIQIEVNEGEQSLVCSIEDNGVGRKSAEHLNADARDHKSMAMKLTKDRLSLLGKGGCIDIIDLEENGKARGTKVLVTIPQVENEV